MPTFKRTNTLKTIVSLSNKSGLNCTVYKNAYIKDLSNEFTLFSPKDNFLRIHSRLTQKHYDFHIFSDTQLQTILMYYGILAKKKHIELQTIVQNWELRFKLPFNTNTTNSQTLIQYNYV